MSESIQEYLNDIKIQQYKTDIGFKTLMEGVNDNIMSFLNISEI